MRTHTWNARKLAPVATELLTTALLVGTLSAMVDQSVCIVTRNIEMVGEPGSAQYAATLEVLTRNSGPDRRLKTHPHRWSRAGSARDGIVGWQP